ncbi:hypothetical protein OAB00_01890 [Akkermansiaceae bacterium]|nr:hypothetical protein [Akkermansiaceae bacterium]
MRAIIIGNLGSGKSTLAANLVEEGTNIALLNLDTLAWSKTAPIRRRPFSESAEEIDTFIKGNTKWVIVGCYSDLIRHALESSTHLYFLNLTMEKCVMNSMNRPCEPRKYGSKYKQDANLPLIVKWIRSYNKREDELSYHSHRAIFDSFSGWKTEIYSNLKMERTKSIRSSPLS